MSEILLFCKSIIEGNYTFNMITLILALIGIFLTIYFAVKSRRKKEPICLMRTISLISSNVKKIERLNILYRKIEIENLSVTKLAFWNNGKETIRSSDIAPKNPIQITIKSDFRILSCDIIYQKNESNGFVLKLSADKKNIIVSFDYVDYLEGIVMQIYHTGNSSSDLVIDGHVMSYGRLSRNNRKLPFWLNLFSQYKKHIDARMHKIILGYTAIFVGIMCTAIGILTFINPSAVDKYISVSDNAPAWVSLVITSIIGLAYAHLGYIIVKRDVPKGFDIYNDEF